MATAKDYQAIRNVIADYCFALDNKDFDALSNVFVPGLKATYPIGARSFSTLSDLSNAIQKRLTHVTSQHAITTQHIVIDAGGKTAKSTSYFTGVHFGQGRWEGQQVTAWGRYVDELSKLDAERWIIVGREVSFMKRLGEERVLEGG